MLRNRRCGIVLVLVAGVLVLLSLLAAALLNLTRQFRVGISVQIDRTAARLLARSGVEYTSARLWGDASPRNPATAGNQADDWTYRDDSGVALEKTRNPSYAQGEPYTDIPENGRYDLGGDPYLDLNGNGRFDAWSGRLRGRYGLDGQTFALKVSGEGAEGGINVNTGFFGDPDHPDLNGNNLPDWADLGLQPQPVLTGSAVYPTPTYPYDRFARNRRIAFVIDQLCRFLGIVAPSPLAVAQTLAATPPGSVYSPASPGDLVIRNRPQGGYQDLENMARLFLPQDWDRLRGHLAIAGRLNASGLCVLYNEPYVPQVVNGVREPDIQYQVNVQGAAPETIASIFAGVDGLTSGDALAEANFIKQLRFISWYDLLMNHKTSSSSPFATGSTYSYANDIGKPEDHGFAWGEMQVYARYNQVRKVVNPKMELWVHPPTGVVACSPGACLGFGSLSYVSIDSQGRVAGRDLLASGRCSAGLRLQGRIESRTQADFENFHFDPVAKRYRHGSRFEGGSIVGPPARDRATTYPCFSRKACPDLEGSPFWSDIADAKTDNSGYTLQEIHDPYDYCRFFGEVMLLDRCWQDPSATFYQPLWDLDQPERAASGRESFTFDRNFDDFSPRKARWTRGSATNRGKLLMDVDQPRAREAYQVKTDILATGRVGGDYQLSCMAQESLDLVFRWTDPPQEDPPQNSNPLKDHPLADPNGEISSGTIEGWYYNTEASAIEQGTQGGRFMLYSGNPSSPSPQNGSRVQQWDSSISPAILGGADGGGPKASTDISTGGGYVSAPTWIQRRFSGGSYDWHDPSPVTDTKSILLAFVFDSSGLEAWINGISHGKMPFFESVVLDPTKAQNIENDRIDELRMYPRALAQAQIQVHAARGRYWVSDPVNPVPGFTSPLYQFDAPTELTEVGWDGYVPRILRSATESWNAAHPDEPKVPLRVELVLYREGFLLVVPLSTESYLTGGYRTDFRRLWASIFPDKPVPKIDALQYRVRLDVSMLDLAWETPVFDAIEIGFRSKRLSGLRELN